MFVWAAIVWNIAAFGGLPQGIHDIVLVMCLSCDPIIGLGAGTPPQEPPPEIVDRLTLNGSVPLEHYYVDDSNKGLGM